MGGGPLPAPPWVCPLLVVGFFNSDTLINGKLYILEFKSIYNFVFI